MNVGDRVKVVAIVGSPHDFMGDEGTIVKLTEVRDGVVYEMEVDFDEWFAVPFMASELEVI
ncbi:hypothetical protein phiPsa267_108 [Pseudomonas phage phiPsa267]|uniref:Uncharacterized protein n=2 Tax=Otagovirus TaxID=2560197 RepID=A0A7G9V155_9CAUD|nr:hypothetical protein CF96_gp117 [Pseudomonas phage phiPsa374]YP_010767718.1 hypothetical protein QGX19_gp122 [Pseudomonas phage phiPsa267]AHJ87363.1 hypothetical protein phiPsa374_103 [Pseudomonas phage phiPsa374]QNO00011.1 hypothetical protein phiPsa267_108 [Pseudomonas phage phiPsa267]